MKRKFNLTIFILLLITTQLYGQSAGQAFNLRGINEDIPQYDKNTKLFNLKGDFLQIGNSVVTTTNTAANNPDNSPGDNGFATMTFNNVDSGSGVLNSSSAQLKFPVNACENKVVAAFLYWTGRATKTMDNSSAGQDRNKLGGYTSLASLESSGTTYHTARFQFTGTGRTSHTFLVNRTTGATTLQIGSGSIVSQTANVNINSSTSTAYIDLLTPIIMYDGTDYQIVARGFQVRTGTNFLSSNNITTYLKAYLDVVYKSNNTPISKDKVKIKAATGTYQTITADPAKSFNAESLDSYIYYSSADVTNFVRNAYSTHGNNVNITVADIFAGATPSGDVDDGTGFFGGWGLAVVYENASLKWREIAVFNGYSLITSTGTKDIPLSGFRTVQTGPVEANLGVMAAEGDYSIVGDYLQIQQRQTATYTTLSVPTANGGNGSTSNFFHARINGGDGDTVNGVSRNPSRKNNTGLDISKITIPNASNVTIGNQQTSTNIRFGTDGDTYAIFSFIFAADAFIPQIHALHSIKPGTPAIPTSGVVPGQNYTYQVSITNKGDDGLTNGSAVINLPKNAIYVGSQSILPATGTTIVHNPADNTITWNIGNIPAGNPDAVLGTFEYTFSIPNCSNVVLDENCRAEIALDGTINGVSTQLGYPIRTRFISGYNSTTTDCMGANEPITEALRYPINISTCTTPILNVTPPGTVCAGTDTELEILNYMNATNVQYQWQKNIAGTWTNISGATGNILSFPSIQTTSIGDYRAVVTRYNPGEVGTGTPCTFYSVASAITVDTCVCYEEPADKSTLVPTKHGITLLGRAAANNSETGKWPILRNSAHTVLEGKTKGLVITRNANPETTIANPIVGMMVFDTDEDSGKGCLKIYMGSGTGEGWKCFTKQTCP